MASAFVSYSWDKEQHKAWVRELAARLCADGMDVTLDQWHLVPGDRLPQFMERPVRDSEHVLIVCTRRYKIRSDSRSSGVGYEVDIMSGEVLTHGNHSKFVPILRQPPWTSSAPSWLAGKYYIDLGGAPYSEAQYQDLLTTLLGTRLAPPPVGLPAIPQFPESTPPNMPAPARLSFGPIKIVGVIVDEVGTPRGDGSPGSALYDVPFRLSRRPPPEWAQLFVAAWDHPSSFSAMHRPGIARESGETIHADGTTVEEVQRYHRDTLLLAAQEANKSYRELLERRHREKERERERIEQHKRAVHEAAKRIKFDE